MSLYFFSVVAASILMGIIGPKFQCFKEGTLVKTKDGLKAIEEIKEGDLVYAYDEKTGKCAYKKVLSLSRNVTKKWCSVSLLVNGKLESIVSTPGHKYYLPFNNSVRDANEVLEHDSYIGLSNKWVSAKDLKCGDKVLLSDGSYGIIDSVIVNDLVEQEVTYNFEVEDFHTYFVGEYCVCVHNTKCDDVIRETLSKKGNITSEYQLSEQELLETGEQFLGEGYSEIGKAGSGVFRNNNYIFRIDNSSLAGAHAPGVPHGHLEIIGENGRRIINNHIIIK